MIRGAVAFAVADCLLGVWESIVASLALGDDLCNVLVLEVSSAAGPCCVFVVAQ